MFLKLSDNLFFMGAGGIVCVEEIPVHDRGTGTYKTTLYKTTGGTYKVKETVDEIYDMLNKTVDLK